MIYGVFSEHFVTVIALADGVLNPNRARVRRGASTDAYPFCSVRLAAGAACAAVPPRVVKSEYSKASPACAGQLTATPPQRLRGLKRNTTPLRSVLPG